MNKELSEIAKRKRFTRIRRAGFFVSQVLIISCTVGITLMLSAGQGSDKKLLKHIENTLHQIVIYDWETNDTEIPFENANRNLDRFLKENNYSRDLTRKTKELFNKIDQRETLLHQDSLKDKTLKYFNKKY
jgi:GTPase involved in cell partitioning and DNA repair